MAELMVHLNGDGCWRDLRERWNNIIHVTGGLQIASLDAGMTSGKPSVSIRIDLPSGKIVIAEMSLALFLTAADALKAKHGDPRD